MSWDKRGGGRGKDELVNPGSEPSFPCKPFSFCPFCGSLDLVLAEIAPRVQFRDEGLIFWLGGVEFGWETNLGGRELVEHFETACLSIDRYQVSFSPRRSGKQGTERTIFIPTLLRLSSS